jgi:hypothetical protein
MTHVPSYKSWPELSRAAIHRHEEGLIRVWYACRCSQGIVQIDTIKTLLSLGDQSIKKYIIQGLGKYWDMGRPDNIRLKSLEKLCNYLEIKPTMHPVWIPITAFENLDDFTLAAFASFFADKERTISHAALAKMYNRKRMTIIRWCQKAEIEVTHNAMLSDRPVEDRVDPELSAQGYQRAWINGTAHMVKKMPNSYKSDMETAPYGLVKRIHVASLPTSTGAARRLYFDNPKGLHKRLAGLTGDEVIYEPTKDCTDDGRRLWSSWQVSPATGGLLHV